MEELFNLSLIQEKLHWLLDVSANYARDPALWAQLVAVSVAFVIARWGLSPLLKRLLLHYTKAETRIPSFRKPLLALSAVSVPITWLILQWFAVGVARYAELPDSAMTVIVSLLSAWVLIHLASYLVANESVAKFIAITAWTVAALNIFGWLQPVSQLLDSWALNLGQVRISPLSVLKIGLALWFGLWLANALATAVERRLAKSESVAPTVQVLSAKLARIGLITAALLIAVSAVGIDLTAFAVFTGALGVGLGFGLQKIFSNLVSGVILLIDRSIKPGDVIAVGTTFGWINHLGARYASVITRDGIEHLIPNEELITQRVENWSYSDKLVRLRIPIGISYRANPRTAMELCVAAAKTVERVKSDPEPKIQLRSFGDSSVNLELRVWIDDPSNGRASIVTEILLGVWDSFHENGIEIPYPQQDIHIQTLLGKADLESFKSSIRAATENVSSS